MKIMLVEDNQKMREMIKQILHRNVKGIEQIIECEDGEEAIGYYSRLQPDWVLMDIKLKTLDGILTTEKIMKAYPNAKIIIVTNYDDSSYQEAATLAGAHEYVLKENLLEIIDLIK